MLLIVLLLTCLLSGCGQQEPIPSERSTEAPYQKEYEAWQAEIAADEDNEWISNIRVIAMKSNPFTWQGGTIFYGASNFAQWRATMERDMFVEDQIHFTSDARSRWAKEYIIPAMEMVGAVKN